MARVSTQTEFDELLDLRELSAEYQPLVDMDSGQPVGYEALARGPAWSEFAAPAELFTHAYRVGRAAELDWVCRAAAISGALAAGLPRDLPLFLNIEPLSLRTPCPPDLQGVMDAGLRDLTLVVELTERWIAADPAAVLSAAREARAVGVGIALDDVGAEAASLALMPLIRPDVIKLDMSLIQCRPGRAVARVANAVLAEAERTGAAIVAEGVETPRHVATARSMGATLAQGWWYGRPSPLPPAPFPSPIRSIPRLDQPGADGSTPFDLIGGVRPTRPATRALLRSLSRHLEMQVAGLPEPAVLASSFQYARKFDSRTRQLYERLADRSTTVVALGVGMPHEPAPGVHGTTLGTDDPLVGEWAVIAVGVQSAAALVARQRRGEDLYDFAITHDRDLAIAAADRLLSRLTAPV